MRHDNYTLYGIHDKTERQLLIGYESLISISSLIGDTLILIGSLRYNAIKLHKILVIFIQYIAVADLLLTVFSILPGAVSLAANDWILGNILCYLSYFVNASCETVICLLISVLALSKMLIVKHPLRAIVFSSNAAHLAVCGMWAYSFILPAVAIARDKDGVFFSYLVYNCIYGCNPDIWNPVQGEIFDISFGLFAIICTVVTVVSSVMFIVLARRVAAKIPGGQWQGVLILTALLTVAVHTVITLPLAIYFIIQHFMADPIYLYRYAWYISLLGAVANFYIFALTLTSFREFLKSRMRMIIAPLMRCCTANEDERSVEEVERRRLL